MGCGLTAQQKQKRYEDREEAKRLDDEMEEDRLSTICKYIKSEEMKIKSEDNPKQFYLDCKDKEIKKLLLVLKREKVDRMKGRLPFISVIKICKIQNAKDMDVRDFLVDHMPKKCDKFHFDMKGKYKRKDFSYYQNELLNIFDSVQKSLHLNGFRLTKNQIELAFKKCSNLKSIHISNSVILSQNVNFDSESEDGKEPMIYKIQRIDLTNCENEDGTHWDKNTANFKGLLKGISQCELKKSLKEIRLNNCGINENIALDLLEHYSLHHIKLLGFEQDTISEDESSESNDKVSEEDNSSPDDEEVDEDEDDQDEDDENYEQSSDEKSSVEQSSSDNNISLDDSPKRNNKYPSDEEEVSTNDRQ